MNVPVDSMQWFVGSWTYVLLLVASPCFRGSMRHQRSFGLWTVSGLVVWVVALNALDSEHVRAWLALHVSTSLYGAPDWLTGLTSGAVAAAWAIIGMSCITRHIDRHHRTSH